MALVYIKEILLKSNTPMFQFCFFSSFNICVFSFFFLYSDQPVIASHQSSSIQVLNQRTYTMNMTDKESGQNIQNIPSLLYVKMCRTGVTCIFTCFTQFYIIAVKGCSFVYLRNCIFCPPSLSVMFIVLTSVRMKTVVVSWCSCSCSSRLFTKTSSTGKQFVRHGGVQVRSTGPTSSRCSFLPNLPKAIQITKASWKRKVLHTMTSSWVTFKTPTRILLWRLLWVWSGSVNSAHTQIM